MKKGGNHITQDEIISAQRSVIESKDEMIRYLLERIDTLDKSVADMSNTIEKLTDELSTYRRMLFGSKSEKVHKEKTDEEPDSESDDTPSDGTSNKKSDTTESSPVNKKHRKSYTHPVKRDYSGIDADKVVEIKPDSKLLDGARLVKVTRSYRFYFVPGKLCKVRYDRYIYSKDGHLITPQLPYVPEAMEKRHADSSLIATILTNKYQFHLPIERQMAILNNGEIKIAKATLHTWAQAGIDSLDGLYEAIREKVLEDDRLNIDETTMRVVDTENHNSKHWYDWGFISPSSKMVFFTALNGSRGSEVLDRQLKDFKGLYITTDSYGAYTNASDRMGRTIIRIPCLCHIRRKFFDSLEYHKELATEALSYIDEIFSNERRYREEKLDKSQIENRRYWELTPLLDKFKRWLVTVSKAKDFLSETNIGKAVLYALKSIDGLYEVIKNGLLEVSNNLAERTMRSHAMGRNSYLFCQNAESASRTYKIYSIIESCKLCKIDPYRYLQTVLSRPPRVGETWSELLPCNINL